MKVPTTGNNSDPSYSMRLLAEVRQATADGSVVVVEGDTDVALFAGLMIEPGPTLVQAGGRPPALSVATAIVDDALLSGRVLVIVDADFDRVTGRIADYGSMAHLIFTDAHDLETMIISVEAVRRRALRTVLRCDLTQSILVWNRALEYQIETGLLSLVAHSEDWGANLTGIPIPPISNPDGSINRGALVEHVLPRLRSAGVSDGPGAIMSLLTDFDKHRSEWMQVVNGHGLCKSISLYARMLIGRSPTPDQIEDGFRLACQIEHLAHFDLTARVRSWCANNSVPAFF